jgi:hypothetical protein
VQGESFPPDEYQKVRILMGTVVNIVLILVAFIGTLSGLGGKAWNEGRGSFFKRATWRGWVALCCLVFSLLLNIEKEIKSQRAGEKNSQLAAENAHITATILDQLTGGDGFPIGFINSALPVNGSNFNLQIAVHGSAPLAARGEMGCFQSAAEIS